MADSVELRMSVTSIKRVDPYVKDILATSTHVALYKFNPISNEWEKTETEGALFLYSRNGEPYHSIMIMNRLNTNNLIEPIVKEFDYQMQTPFLLYRNCKSKIFGIWFFNPEECVTITYLLETLMQGLKEKSVDKSKKRDNGVDIFSMLSKAQEDLNKTPIKTETQPQFSSTPRAPDVTSQSVLNFFAKVSNKSAKKQSGSGSENIFQRLMSNPAHSVEHIEKQQRSVTPQEQVLLRQKSNNGQSDRRSVPISFSSANMNSERPSDGVLGASPQQIAASPLNTFFMQQANPCLEDPAEISGTSPLAKLLETPQKPALMPPMMFTSATKDKSEELGALDKFRKNDASVLGRNVEPLTKNQLLQALNYLLRTDADFVTKLHDAYVKSLTEMVNQTNAGN